VLIDGLLSVPKNSLAGTELWYNIHNLIQAHPTAPPESHGFGPFHTPTPEAAMSAYYWLHSHVMFLASRLVQKRVSTGTLFVGQGRTVAAEGRPAALAIGPQLILRASAGGFTDIY
jgi:hypothetical protein